MKEIVDIFPQYWRASLVPAAAVIPASRAYVKVAVVEKFVFGHLLLTHRNFTQTKTLRVLRS